MTADHIRLIRPPLAVGDVLDDDSPEPPIGTIVLCGDIAWQRMRSGQWFSANAHADGADWSKWGFADSTVLYVPDADS